MVDKKPTASDILQEIQDAQRRMKDWHERGGRVESLYRGEGDGVSTDSDKFKILWTITEMQRPLIYDERPDPVVRRRFLEEDEAARIGSKIVERALMYSMEAEGHEFQKAVCEARDDFLLPGRGTCRVVYNASIKTDPQKIYLDEDEIMDLDEDVELERDQIGPYRWSKEGEPQTQEKKEFEEVYLDHVHWRDHLHSDGKRWQDVWWNGFASWLTKEDLEEQFGKAVADEVKVLKNYSYEEEQYKPYKAEMSAYGDYARVWEVWDKRTNMVYKVAEYHDEFLEDPIEDPYGLEGFFPCPEPVYMIKTTGSLEPVPEYKMYEDQAMELNTITGRIDRLTDSLAVRGIGDGRIKASLSRLFDSRETQILIDENYAQVAASGGIEAAIGWAPIGPISQVLQHLMMQRDKNLEVIWNIVGLSDILRGSTNPRESGKAQQLKYQMVGGMRSRMGNKQKRMQRFARDCICLMAEVIAELFSEETMFIMTGVQPDQLREITMQEVMGLLRKDKVRGFRIDVETDSTIAKDEMREKEEITEFFGAITQLIGAAQGAAASGMMSPTALRQLVLFAAKRFATGRDIEDMLEQAFQGEQQKANPEEDAKQLETQIKMMKLQMDREDMMADNMMKAEEIKLKWAKLSQDGQVEMAKIAEKRLEAMINLQTATVNAQGGNASK